MNPKTLRRLTVVAGAIGAHGVIALLLFLLLFIAALFYGPAWSALHVHHGPFVASLICAAVPAVVWWVIFAVHMIVTRWNTTAEDDEAEVS